MAEKKNLSNEGFDYYRMIHVIDLAKVLAQMRVTLDNIGIAYEFDGLDKDEFSAMIKSVEKYIQVIKKMER